MKTTLYGVPHDLNICHAKILHSLHSHSILFWKKVFEFLKKSVRGPLGVFFVEKIYMGMPLFEKMTKFCLPHKIGHKKRNLKQPECHN